ncbi:eukaryotic translation initiation factor 5B [Malassezia yamatoensis]|uniref:Eukaryotic translation initiation factor 5B n=1 Tax=Malassezia yamatoensis TaxID=253288 RepID=A0AAJ5YY96_9BASI|nr:eukaryotic translation initiation factor 5B [Malassezia yamatoensis]
MGKKKGGRKDEEDPFADLGEDVSQNQVKDEHSEDQQPESEQSTAADHAETASEPTIKESNALEQDPGQGEDAPKVRSSEILMKLLTKKEKERLKKEKEKAKKKAQAEKKKTQNAPQTSPATAQEQTPTDTSEANSAQPEEQEDSENEGGAAASDKKKKKKKKKAAAEPAPSAGKKPPSAAVAALQARIAAQKKAEEEARLREEEARRQIEEEERRERMEEEQKEQERQRRKEKERLKRERLKKEGKLLTPKQRAELKAAEARKAALLASNNVSVAGMHEHADGEHKGRVVYDRKKKNKDAKAKPVQEAAPAASSEPVEAAEPEVKIPVKEALDQEDIKDSWDAESDNEDANVKDDWDADSDDEQLQAQNLQSSAAKQQETASTKAELGAPTQTAEKPEQSSEEDDDDDSDDDEDDESSSEDEDEQLTVTQKQAQAKREAAERRRKEEHQKALAERSQDNLRSPICCILGHVDTGKTKLLDKVRQTNVQDGEAGGITQQIGATYFPIDALKEKTKVLDDPDFEYKVPGLLIIDTPGHESFTNLRSRGSSLCNIAILVVDIMHGLEQQTLESMRLLRDRKTPFIVALNKIDRLYDWKATPNNAFQKSLAQQSLSTQNEFEERVQKTILAFAEQGLNAELYYKNKNMGRYVSLVPTSAISGEGVPDLLQLLVSLTQSRMTGDLMYLSELECTVLEVKVIEGLGTTIDVVLSNGILREGDRIVVCGLNGPIVTQVRALLTPQPMKEMRVKGSYVHHKEVKAALGVKITAPDLDKAVAGSRLLVCKNDDEEEVLKEEVMSDLTSLMNSVDKSGRGVCVQASTLGSLEALLEFLKQSKIPVSGVNIGPVYKRDVMRCATMLEKAKELACILCFDVPVDKDAERLAEELGIKLFTADIIYHLFDSFMAYKAEITESHKRDAASTAVWPCRLRTITAFAKRDPIILGCDILDGTLRIGTPLCVVKTDPNTRKREVINIGRVTSLEINHKAKDVVLKKDVGAGVAVRIEPGLNDAPKMFGRHLDEKDDIYSLISRNSIDALKAHFWDGVSTEEKRLIKNLKTLLDIP